MGAGSSVCEAKPNFFVVGASKCGTTSLYNYLRQHPEVFMTDRKEPHFFSTDVERPHRITEEEYFELFQRAGNRKRIGEASADYLYSRDACDAIKRRFPDAKIVIALRNPVDKVHSGHAYELWLGREDIEDFEQALLRRDYVSSAKYSDNVGMYLRAFGQNQVHIIIFEEMTRDPESTFKELCRFLEIRDDVRVNFERYNAAKKARIQRLAPLFRPASIPVRYGKRLPRGLRHVLGTFARTMKNWNTRFEERPPMRPDLRLRLEREFVEDVAKLSTIVGRDLTSYWFPRYKDNDVPLLPST